MKSEQTLQHAALVALAGKWLQKRCSVVITEMQSGSYEQADAIGWGGGFSYLVECKASRSDFLADAKKSFRQHPESGMGYYRWFMSPLGMLSTDELPRGWGLIEVGARVREVKKPQPFYTYNRQHENNLLISALRRVAHNAPMGVSVKCYTYETKCTATLGVEEIPNEDR
jgi:hypothetical protein